MNNYSNLNTSIVDSIDDLEMIQMESDFSTLSALMDYYNKQSIIMEYAETHNVDEIFQEGTSSSKKSANVSGTTANTNNKVSTTKPNQGILRTIWEAIKKFFKWIGRLITRLINAIKGLFSKNKNVQPAETIASNCEKISEEEAAKYNKSVKVNVQELSNGLKKTTTTIPSHPKSTVKPQNVTRIESDVIELHIHPNKPNTVNMKFKDVGNFSADFVKEGGLRKGMEDPSALTYRIPLAVSIIIDPDQKAIHMIEEIVYLMTDSNPDLRLLTDKINALKKINETEMKNLTVKNGDEISVERLVKFNADINKTTDKIYKMKPNFENLKNPNVPNINKTINNLYSILLCVNFGMNHIFGLFKGYDIYVVDDKLVARSADEWSKTVESMIKQGYPAKYVGYNAWILGRDLISVEENSWFDPKWGQTRVVFFDKGDTFVYKLALNGAGFAANRAEKHTSDVIEQMKHKKKVYEQLIAPVRKTFNNYAIITMDKANTEYECSQDICDDIKDLINNLIREKGLFVDDVHSGNVGMMNGQWVVIDYGCDMLNTK